MTRHLLFLVTTFLMFSPALADPVFGEWKTETSDQKQYSGNYIHVRIHKCGKGRQQKVCGTISKVVGNDANIVGMNILKNLTPKGAGEYSGGTVWAPDRDATFMSKMQLRGNKLKVSGCIAGGLLCKSQTWTRL